VDNLIDQYLKVLARGEASLYEVPLGMIDHLPNGETFTWPAQDPNDCREVLLAWLDEGLIGIYRFRPSGNVALSKSDARALLDDPTSWDPGIGCALYLTDRGRAVLLG
jgi:hypothetical protein